MSSVVETSSGRPIRRVRHRFDDINQLIILVARGTVVHPTVAPFASYFGHPGVVYLPIVDMPPAKSALVWRRRNSDPRLRQFIGVARTILRAARASDQPSAPIARSTRHPRLDDDSGAA